jgi:hypothetical protein
LAPDCAECFSCDCAVSQHWWISLSQGSMLWSQFSAIFDTFRQKNWRFSQKPMLWSIFLKNSFVLSQKRQYFRWIFRRKYFKNHNIGPWFTRTAQIANIGSVFCIRQKSDFWIFLSFQQLKNYVSSSQLLRR